MINKKKGLLAGIWAIVFVVYNVTLFVVSGVSNNGRAFWVSYAFMLVALLMVAGAGIISGRSGKIMRDWLLKYPLMRHTAIYLVVEFALSTLFISLKTTANPILAFVTQFVVLGIYLVFGISCIIARDMIIDVQADVKRKTEYIRELRTESLSAAECCEDATVRKAFADFAEQVKYSDPVSNDALARIEQEISNAFRAAKNDAGNGNYASALESCKKAVQLLNDRNRQCKLLK